jgi:5-methylcytosine-specific restriction endonuclease McrA
MFIVRYADDFKIFCRCHSDAVRAYKAVTQWINERLKLEISDEKSKITNLKNNYTEFLGFKIGTQIKGNKRVVRSHISDKAKKKLIKQFREMFREAKHKNLPYFTVRINAAIYGRQQYYNIATLVSRDFAEIDFLVSLARKHALSKKGSKNGLKQDLYIKMYGESKAKEKYLNGVAVFPVHFVRYNTPINFSPNICNYTPEGRKYIHDNLSKNCVEPKIMQYMLSHPNPRESVLLHDNRLSLYVAQNGKCHVLGEKLEIGKMEVHHKKPRSLGGTDRYDNLIFLNDDIHKLIHMTDIEKIKAVVKEYNLNAKQLAKVNKLREMACNFTI